MRDKSYDWSEAAEDWANEVLGEDDSHQIALPDANITPHIETFTPDGAPSMPEGFTCEDTPRAPADLNIYDPPPFARSENTGTADALDGQAIPTFRTRRTIVKVVPKAESTDTDTFVFSPNANS